MPNPWELNWATGGGTPRPPDVIKGPPLQPTPQTPGQAALTGAQTTAARLQAQQTQRELATPVLTPGQKAADEAFGKDYVDWNANGGFAGVRDQLAKLRDAHTRLGGSANLTGPILGRTPDWITSFTNPSAIDVRQETHSAIQASLRQVLGAQFTEEEGKRIMGFTYDPQLPEHTNRLRITRLYNQIAAAAKAKESASKYFEQKGTLAGWNGRLWSPHDFDPDRPAARPLAQPIQASPNRVVHWNDLP